MRRKKRLSITGDVKKGEIRILKDSAGTEAVRGDIDVRNLPNRHNTIGNQLEYDQEYGNVDGTADLIKTITK